MFIDTHTKESMIASICNIFNFAESKLNDVIDKIIQKAADEYDYSHKIDELICKRTTEHPDEILFFHLSRRLLGTENETNGHNLADMLLTNNAFSNLLTKYGIRFSKGVNHIETTYNGRQIDWDQCCRGNSSYMKLRLGYYEGREDFCFNGFALKDLLYKNDYARNLSGVPEFLGQLIECLGCKSLGNYYMKNSKYYCYEYKVPIDIVIFDGKDEYHLLQKQHHLIRCVLDRIIEYRTQNIRFIFDHDNPILRLPDDYTLPSNYFIEKEEITSDMLM